MLKIIGCIGYMLVTSIAQDNLEIIVNSQRK